MGKEHSPTAAVVLGGGHLDGGGDSALITHHRAAVTSNGDTRVKHLQCLSQDSQACQPSPSSLFPCRDPWKGKGSASYGLALAVYPRQG